MANITQFTPLGSPTVHPADTVALKSCDRCEGDLYLTSDHYGVYQRCLQCGRTTYPGSSSAPKPPQPHPIPSPSDGRIKHPDSPRRHQYPDGSDGLHEYRVTYSNWLSKYQRTKIEGETKPRLKGE